MVCLIKPQFEAGKEKVGKKGVVREPEVHVEVIEKVIDYAISIGFEVLHLDFSPIRGPEGNIEYLVHIQKNAELAPAEMAEEDDKERDMIEESDSEVKPHEQYRELIDTVVKNAHTTLNQ